jgi:hypothetical protein
MKTRGYIKVTFVFREHHDRWTGKCRELGTATFGNSFEDIKEKLEEAVLCHLNTLEDIGERGRFFRKHGIRFYVHKPKLRETRLSVPYDPKVLVQSRFQPIFAEATA